MNSERESPTAGEAGQDKPHPPSLLDRLRALFGLGGASIRDDIQDALEDPATGTDLSAQERTMLKNVLGLHEVRVEDVMVPRPDIVAVSMDMRLADVLAVFRTAGHSRLPVHGDTLDDPRGMVHIRDFVDHVAEGQAASTSPDHAEPIFLNMSQTLAEAEILRPVLFVPPSMPALDLLIKMQATRTHMALVIDEYGGTDGIASMEDIVEMIVGDIEDEHDLEEGPKIAASPDGNFVADARADLTDVSRAIGIDLATISDAEDIDTLGGLVTTLAGHVPVRGEIIVEAGLEFEVLDADPRRVKRIKIHTRDRPRVTGPTGTGAGAEADRTAGSHVVAGADPKDVAL